MNINPIRHNNTGIIRNSDGFSPQAFGWASRISLSLGYFLQYMKYSKHLEIKKTKIF